MTISSRKTSNALAPSTLTLVTAAVFLISDIEKLIYNVKYPDNGFGALLLLKTMQVVVWKKNYQTFNYTTSSYLQLSTVDPALASAFKLSSSFNYTDASGSRWIVSSVPFFKSNDYKTGVSSNVLIMLVFAGASEAEAPLASLKENINSTTKAVTNNTLIIIFSICFGIMIFVFFMVRYITSPLDLMRSLSKSIIEIAAEDDENRNYSEIVNRSFFDLNRSDEVGILASQYFHIVCKLHNKNVEKKSRPKYPDNPFHLDGMGSFADFGWAKFYSAFKRRQEEIRASSNLASQINGENVISVNPVKEEEEPDVGLDVLSGLTAKANKMRGSPSIEGGGSVSVFAVPSNASDATSFVSSGPVGGVGVGEVYRSDNYYKNRGDGGGGRSAAASVDFSAVAVSELAATAISINNSLQEIELIAIGGGNSNIAVTEATLIPFSADKQSTRFFSSIRSYLLFLVSLLLCGLLAIMIITVVSLRNEGDSWMTKTGSDMETTQMLNLQYIAIAKASFVKSFFQQVFMDITVTSATVTAVLDKNLTGSNYLKSYSLDKFNMFVPSDGTTTSYKYSGYFDKSDGLCYQNTPSSCYQENNATITKEISVLDYKFQSIFHTKSFVSYLQLGLNSSGYVRQFPYLQSDLSHPTSCLISDTSSSNCYNEYKNSKCNGVSASYPYYDPQCRNWFVLGERSTNINNPLVLTPRISSNGQYVVTVFTPIRADGINNGNFYGVLNFNVLANRLSSAINTLKILNSGYCYLINSVNSSYIVLHPNAPSGCVYVSCAEGFSGNEYATFYQSVLLPIQSNVVEGSSLSVSNSYQKGGQTWRLAYAKLVTGSISYTLIATVLESDIMEASLLIQKSIDGTVVSMIVAFVFAMFFFIVILYFFVLYLIRAIVNPFYELTALCQAIISDDLSKDIPTAASSLDMKILLDAFSKLMIALRFSSESYARGNRDRAIQVFEEALKLYTATDNKRGIGASHNNLGAVLMGENKFSDAESEYLIAIEIQENILKGLTSEGDISRAKRVLSDRLI